MPPGALALARRDLLVVGGGHRLRRRALARGLVGGVARRPAGGARSRPRRWSASAAPSRRSRPRRSSCSRSARGPFGPSLVAALALAVAAKILFRPRSPRALGGEARRRAFAATLAWIATLTSRRQLADVAARESTVGGRRDDRGRRPHLARSRSAFASRRLRLVRRRRLASAFGGARRRPPSPRASPATALAVALALFATRLSRVAPRLPPRHPDAAAPAPRLAAVVGAGVAVAPPRAARAAPARAARVRCRHRPRPLGVEPRRARRFLLTPDHRARGVGAGDRRRLALRRRRRRGLRPGAAIDPRHRRAVRRDRRARHPDPGARRRRPLGRRLERGPRPRRRVDHGELSSPSASTRSSRRAACAPASRWRGAPAVFDRRLSTLDARRCSTSEEASWLRRRSQRSKRAAPRIGSGRSARAPAPCRLAAILVPARPRSPGASGPRGSPAANGPTS